MFLSLFVVITFFFNDFIVFDLSSFYKLMFSYVTSLLITYSGELTAVTGESIDSINLKMQEIDFQSAIWNLVLELLWLLFKCTCFLTTAIYLHNFHVKMSIKIAQTNRRKKWILSNNRKIYVPVKLTRSGLVNQVPSKIDIS